MTSIPPLPSGYKREWLRCRKCRRVYHFDFIPFSLSNPVRWTGCGHDEGRRDLNCDTITEGEARDALGLAPADDGRAEMHDLSLTAVAKGQREDGYQEGRAAAIAEVADVVRGWRNDHPLTGDECANAILHHFGTEASALPEGNETP